MHDRRLEEEISTVFGEKGLTVLLFSICFLFLVVWVPRTSNNKTCVQEKYFNLQIIEEL